MTDQQLIENYYKQLLEEKKPLEELRQLKNERIREVRRIESAQIKEEFTTAKHYMAQVAALDKLIKETQTVQNAKKAWQELTTPPKEDMNFEEDDFDAFLDSLSAGKAQEKKSKIPTPPPDDDFDDAFEKAFGGEETEYDDWEADFDADTKLKNKKEKKKKDESNAISHNEKKGDTEKKGKKEKNDAKKGKISKLWFILPLSLLLVLILMVVANLFVLPMYHYNRGEKSFERSEYAEAMTQFKDAAGYRDAETCLTKATYQYALQLMGDGEFEQALNYFRIVSGYEDADEQWKECTYQNAAKQYDDGKYAAAKASYLNISGYKDADELAQKCDKETLYRQALDKMDSSDFSGAAEILETLEDYSDSKTQLEKCNFALGKVAYENKDYKTAASYFEKVGDDIDKLVQDKETAYMLARSFEESGALNKADELYGSSAGYQDTAARRAYVQALLLAETGDTSALEDLDRSGSLDSALLDKIAAFSKTYGSFMGTYASDSGSRTVTVGCCVVDGEVKLRYVGDYMPKGEFVPGTVEFDKDNNLVLGIQNGEYTLTLIKGYRKLEIICKHGNSEYDYIYTKQ